MLISFNWLKQHIKLPDSITAEEVAEKLKLATVEVEKVERQGAQLENIVVGKVLKCEKHPNADKLKVCMVDIGGDSLPSVISPLSATSSRSGSEDPSGSRTTRPSGRAGENKRTTVQIVCGGSNVAEGMLVAVAKSGAKVKWHGEGELVELKPTVIRGVESNGMICASDEIGLGEMFPKKEEKEILDLSSTNGAVVGSPLAVAIGSNDTILEIDNKSLSNRPDLWGHYGMAREVAALFNKKLELYTTKEIKKSRNQEIKLKVEIEDAKLCPRYMAVAMSDIKVIESPAWLKQRLSAVGIRPINNIVDITNYVMLDVGQPMHAFDAFRIANPKPEALNPKIIVRRASEGDKFVTLDGKKHALTNEMLVIANEEKAIALAGVMGGGGSGITNETTAIVFESANFDAASIRKTSTKLGLRTDSSARFEKSLDPAQCETALKRAVELVLEMSPGAKVASKVVDENAIRRQVRKLEIPVNFFEQKLGIKIETKKIVGILERLGFEVTAKKEMLSVLVPTWRATKDITIAEDVVEEVARVYGYENIPASLPVFPINPPEKNMLRALERDVADVLVSELAYTEVYNYSFVSGAQITAMGDDFSKYLELDNPLSKEKPYLRRCLVFNLLENVKHNIPERQQLRLFEIGKVFRPEQSGLRAEANGDELLPGQDTWLTTVYVNKKDTTPFWEAHRVVETLAERLGLSVAAAKPTEQRLGRHPSRSVELKVGDVMVGSFYELHPMVSQQVGIEERIGIVKLNLSQLVELVKDFTGLKNYTPIALYPEVIRDIAFVVKKETTHLQIYSALSNADQLVKKVELFDVFEGKGISEGYKSMAYHITYAHPERTLTTEEVDKVQQKVEKVLQEKFGAEVRK